MKSKNTTLLEQFQNPIGTWLKEAISIPLTHKYMIAHVTGTLIKTDGFELVLWCGDTSVFNMHI
jgi:hypothetical protein